MYLVDSSIWIDLFNNKATPFIIKAFDAKQLSLTSLIYFEVLQGVKIPKLHNRIKDILLQQNFYSLNDVHKSYEQAAQIYRKCRQNGITINSSIDCLIAQCAIENKLTLLHNDQDFIKIAQVVPTLAQKNSIMQLDQSYNQDDYLAFLVNKFNFSKYLQHITIANDDVKSFKRLGHITTADNKKLPVFEAYIKQQTKLARNRVGLRNLAVQQIKQGASDGALAVYIDDISGKWRFSFIAIEPKFDNNGNIITQETASKRFTYLLGEGSQTRTASEQFNKLSKQSSLADLTEAFAVEPLSKEFYDKLYKWYELAQNKAVFPNDTRQDNHIQNSLIRLLTRLLFIWFLKEKKLINVDLFSLNKLKSLIDWDKDSSFYKAILQNLFFATLSTEINNREFSSEKRGYKGWNKDFGNQYVFRYQKLFSEPDKIKDYFNNIPFLNGGLFECLDDKKNGLYIDGFSRTKKHQPTVANDLFFNEDKHNLGLINLFNQYQFTATESTPLDIEVALDPELLGKVFENLLASYNPETGTEARKASGSFYTPREIVSYMVDESLKAYLTQKVPPHDNDNEFYKERLNDLFETSDKTGELPTENGTTIIYDEEIPLLIAAISRIKILDPAVGSGAYPMGLLQRMTALLAILDPDNKKWQAQKLAELPDLASLEQDIKITEQLSNAEARQKAQQILNNKRDVIISNFNNQDHNYLRKLYLIEKLHLRG